MTDIVERLQALGRCEHDDFSLGFEAADEIKRLHQRVKELEKKLVKAQDVPMKYKRMEFNAQLQNENERLEKELAALKSSQQAAHEAGQGEPVAYQFQDRDGKWCNFAGPKHYEATVADGSWPIRALYTSAPTIPEGWQLVPVNVIAFYEAALKASWPNGAIGDAFENWNEARKSMLDAAPKP